MKLAREQQSFAVAQRVESAPAGAMSPVIFGRAFDSKGSYVSLLIILAVGLLVGAAMNLLLPQYPKSTVEL